MRHLMLLLVLAAACGQQRSPAGKPGNAIPEKTKASAASKSQNPMLELHSPKGPWTLVLSRPALAMPAGTVETPWRRIEVKGEDGAPKLVMDYRMDQPGTAVFPYWE